MAQQQISPGSINAAIAALRFFFTVTLERPDLVRPLTTVNKPRKAPVVLSEGEVARLLEAAPGLKYKAALSVAYGAGLRVSEVANLKVSCNRLRPSPRQQHLTESRIPPRPRQSGVKKVDQSSVDVSAPKGRILPTLVADSFETRHYQRQSRSQLQGRQSGHRCGQ